MSDIKFVEDGFHNHFCDVYRGDQYVGYLFADNFDGRFHIEDDIEGLSKDDLRAIADEMDRRNGVKDES